MPLGRTRYLNLHGRKVPPAVSPARSALMARVKQQATAPELVVRRLARTLRLHFSTNGKNLPGSPDIFTVSPKRAVFVHGCFWHRHGGCKATTTPNRHRNFWLEKFSANMQRDRRKIRRLRFLGFRVMVIWECQVKSHKKLDSVERRLMRFFAGE